MERINSKKKRDLPLSINEKLDEKEFDENKQMKWNSFETQNYSLLLFFSFSFTNVIFFLCAVHPEICRNFLFKKWGSNSTKELGVYYRYLSIIFFCKMLKKRPKNFVVVVVVFEPIEIPINQLIIVAVVAVVGSNALPNNFSFHFFSTNSITHNLYLFCMDEAMRWKKGKEWRMRKRRR